MSEHRTVWPVLVISGALGFVFGAFNQPTWQDAIEPAQVLARVVTYPSDNPVYLYSTHTWTILHQVVALWIVAGVPERTLAIVISGGLGLVSFQALALTSWAMGARPLVAALVPMMVYASSTARFDTGYPLDLVGSPCTYGFLAMGLLALLFALVASGRDRAAALLAGIFPAVHLTVGLWAWVIVGLCAWPFRREWIPRARAVAPWFGAGLAVTAASAAVHYFLFAPVMPAQPPGAPEIVAGVRLYWDSHRAALDWSSRSVVAAVVLPLFHLVWFRQYGAGWPRAARWMPAGLAIAVAIALANPLAGPWLPAGVSHAFELALPSRLLNLPLLTCIAFIVGIATSPAAPAGSRVLVGGALIVVTLVHLPELTGVPSVYDSLSLLASGDWRVLTVATAVTLVAMVTLTGWLPARAHAVFSGWPIRTVDAALPAALALLTLLSFVELGRTARGNLQTVTDRTNNRVLFEAAARPGLLLTASNLHLVQAATRRPVLVDGGAIDGLAYVPQAAPVVDRIARLFYGLTLTAAVPDGERITGTFPESAGRDLWARWSLSEWQARGEEFAVTDVLTFADWQLSLPLIARDEALALWTIPRR